MNKVKNNFEGSKGKWVYKEEDNKIIEGTKSSKIVNGLGDVVCRVFATHKDKGMNNQNLLVSAPRTLHSLIELVDELRLREKDIWKDNDRIWDRLYNAEASIKHSLGLNKKKIKSYSDVVDEVNE